MRVSFCCGSGGAGRHFPSFSEGLSLREAEAVLMIDSRAGDFPSFSEGLSLRGRIHHVGIICISQFPFLFGGTFIEGIRMAMQKERRRGFPFLFGGTFIEGGAHA